MVSVVGAPPGTACGWSGRVLAGGQPFDNQLCGGNCWHRLFYHGSHSGGSRANRSIAEVARIRSLTNLKFPLFSLIKISHGPAIASLGMMSMGGEVAVDIKS